MTAGDWSREESRQALAMGVAPLVVSGLLAAIAGLWSGHDSWPLLVVLVPMAYASLFFFVLPALWLVRRCGRGSPMSFALASGLGVLVPWLVLYLLFFPNGTGKYAGAPLQIALMLAPPALLAAAAGAVVFRLGRPTTR